MFFTLLVLFPLLTQFKPYRWGKYVFQVHVVNYHFYIKWVPILPPRACRCQDAPHQGVQPSTPPLPQPEWHCPRRTHWQTLGGLRVEVLHFFLLRHLPPRSESQSRTLWDPGGPTSQMKESQPPEHKYAGLRKLIFNKSDLFISHGQHSVAIL